MTTLEFTVEGIAPGALAAFEATGTEAVSSLYAFDVSCELMLDEPPDPSVVGARATLVITPDGAAPRLVQGVVDGFDVATPTVAGRPPVCRFRLVPFLSNLQLSRQNQVFGTGEPVTVGDIVSAELSGTLRMGTRAAPIVPNSFAFELRLKQSYPPLDHLAQYQETNYAFLSRLCERYGIFFFFENGPDGEVAVFADDNLFAPRLDGDPVLHWRAWSSGIADAVPDTVQRLEARHERAPGRVFLQDYNYRLPNLPLLAEQAVDADGTGVWTEHGDRFLTPAEGQFLARIRAEELECRTLRLEGRSMVARLAAGRVFDLADHPFASWNRAYLVLSVRHHARVPRPGVDYAPDDPAGYWNEFTVLPLDVPFRPERRTRQPRLEGLLNGRIEGGASGSGPLLDDQGRYKVRLPFDLSNTPDAQGSRWVRMATPFAGDAEGMHFPLHPGTEVVVAHVNGDPDRPVILGAVPNPATPSPVNDATANHNRIAFRSGMGLYASTEDSAGNLSAATNESSDLTNTTATASASNAVRVWTQSTPNTSPAAPAPSPYQWLRIGAASGTFTDISGTAVSESVGGDATNVGDGFDLATGGVGRIFAGRDIYLIRNGTAPVSTGKKTDTGNRLISVTDSQLYLAHDGDIVIGDTASGSLPDQIFMNANNGISQHSAAQSEYTTGNNSQVTGGSTNNATLGSNNTLTIGLTINAAIGGVINSSLAYTMNLSLGSSLNINVGFTLNMFTALNFTYEGESFKLVDSEIAIKANETRLTTMETSIGSNTTSITGIHSRIGAEATDINSIETKLSETSTSIAETKTDLHDTQLYINSITTALNDTDAEVTGAKLFV